MAEPESGGGLSSGGHNSRVSRDERTTGPEDNARRGSTAGVDKIPSSTAAGTSQKGHAFNVAKAEGKTASTSQSQRSTRHGHSKTSVTHAQDPPVTKATLSELDVNKIVHNPKLRHDINFDPELHFRPNLDGEKGRRKASKAKEFWDQMRRQLELFLTDREAFERSIGTGSWCLPATLHAIRGILETLVPQRDRAAVDESLNVDLLMQQFAKGVANLEKLAQWLSMLLKSHCAPMRDDWVDDMVQQLSVGEKTGDVNKLVEGMRTLLGVLEAMKLDVANHQIRCLRPLLIDDTVHFELRFFERRIDMHKFCIQPAQTWFRAAKQNAEATSSATEDIWIFFSAFVDLLMPTTAGTGLSRPETFVFDDERIMKLRSDLLDAINFEVCMRLFHARNQDIRRSRLGTATPLTPASVDASRSELSSPMVPGMMDFTMASSRADVPERPLSALLAARNPRLQSRSPMSLSSISTPPTPCTPVFSAPNTQSGVTRETLYQNILAILDDCSDTSDARWALQIPAIALEILRATRSPLSQVAEFEKYLHQNICCVDSSDFQEAEKLVRSQLQPQLEKMVGVFVPLSALQVFEAATAPKMTATASNLPSVAEIATRIAHIGILHWRVWATMAYLKPDDESGRDNGESSDTTMTDAADPEAMDLDPETRRKHPQQRQNSVSEIPTHIS